MKKLLVKRPDIAFYVKVFLLEPGPESLRVATSIACSGSLAMLDDAFEKKTVPPPACATKEIDENVKFAQENGINSAPAIIFPDGSVHFGFLPGGDLEKEIDKAARIPKTGAVTH